MKLLFFLAPPPNQMTFAFLLSLALKDLKVVDTLLSRVGDCLFTALCYEADRLGLVVHFAHEVDQHVGSVPA